MAKSKNKYLITGGTGYLGHELIARLEGDITVVARNEGKLIELKEKFPHIKIITGDISDQYIADMAVKGQDGVFHLAAFKHIGLAEEQSRQCVLSNVIGTLNILQSCKKYKPKFILGISTDKAAQVNGVYGATKLLMERLFQEYEKQNTGTKHRLVRYGNILYSTGSVLCKWKDKMQKGEVVTITDPNATRFYWTVGQAVDLIFSCLENATDCTPYVTEMKSIRIGDLLDVMMEKYGLTKVNQIGLQQGENLHEKILEGGPYSNEVEQYTKEEIRLML